MTDQPTPAGENSAQVPRPTPAPPLPAPPPRPRPPAMPRPAAQAPAAPTAPVAPLPDESREAAAAAAWGRVDADGTVWVRETAGERQVGQYPGADGGEALALYVRRFLDLQAQVLLLEARLSHLGVREIDQSLASLTEQLTEPAAVGDLDGLRSRLEILRERAEARRTELAQQRDEAKQAALAERTTIVEMAEKIAATPTEKIHWRDRGHELRELLEQWKHAQRNGPRLDRPVEDGLWKRFSSARSSFEKRRSRYFADLDAAQTEAKTAKEKLVSRAEELSSSRDWAHTASAYRALMDEWKQAGRASRKDDDALWARFRAAQQVFFDARNEQNAQLDAEYQGNLEVKLKILEEAEKLLPVTDPDAAKQALRPLQDRWEAAGRVPRGDLQRVEARMRTVEEAVRRAESERWQRSDPEKRARAEGLAAQLAEAIADLERDVVTAEERGDDKAAATAREALAARRAWLEQVERNTD